MMCCEKMIKGWVLKFNRVQPEDYNQMLLKC